MLAPNDLEILCDTFKHFYMDVTAADQLALMEKSIHIYPFREETNWIKVFRNQSTFLHQNGIAWQDRKAAIVSSVLSPFGAYKNTFEPVANFLGHTQDIDTAVILLNQLIKKTEENIRSVHNAASSYGHWLDDTALNIAPLEKCIHDGWKELGNAEQDVIRLSEEIVQLQNNLQQLDGVITLDSLSSHTVSGISNIMTNTASMIYSVAVAGYAVPYLTVISTFFTLGKTFYDIFSTADKLQQEIQALIQHKRSLSFAQTALAQTKAVLTTVYDIKANIIKQHNSINLLEAFWENERRNLSTVKNHLLASNDYRTMESEILQLPIANSVWFSLKDISKQLLADFDRAGASHTEIKIHT